MKSLIDSTSALALTSAVLYVLGWVWESDYLLYYGLTTSQFMPPPPDVILLGFLFLYRLGYEWWPWLLSFGIFLIVAMGLRSVLFRRWSPKITAMLGSLPRWMFIFPAFALLIVGIRGAARNGWEQGWERAEPDRSSSPLRHVVITPKDSQKQFEGLIIAYVDGTYALIEDSSRQVIVIRKEDVRVVAYSKIVN